MVRALSDRRPDHRKKEHLYDGQVSRGRQPRPIRAIMPLRDFKVGRTGAALPANVRVLLCEATQRIKRFQRAHRIPGFVSSDHQRAYHALRALTKGNLLAGEHFCEWGSGFGVVACLAAMLGFDACGIEIEGQLVDAAQKLADDFGLPVEFIRGSFIPHGPDPYQDTTEEFAWLTPDESTTYEELGLGPDDFDVIFAYPWPDEERLTEHLFELHAAVGAVLVTYHESGDLRLRRKTGR